MSVEGFPLEEHFGVPEAQRQAAHLGMWVFIGTEVLLFAALFTSYGVYRWVYPEVFVQGHHHMSVGLGTANTFILVTSSILVAVGIWSVRSGREMLAGALVLGAAVFGLAFLVIKGVEYAQHVKEGALPGAWYALEKFAAPGASLFFTLYWVMTGLHALHVTVGTGVLVVLGFQAWAGKFNQRYHVPLELGGMYWHLVDAIWLFLYPLLYLA